MVQNFAKEINLPILRPKRIRRIRLIKKIYNIHENTNHHAVNHIEMAAIRI